MEELSDHFFKASDNTLTLDGFPSDGEYIMTIRGGSFHSIVPRSDLHDDLVKAADALAAEATLCRNCHEDDAKYHGENCNDGGADYNRRRMQKIDAALTAYRKARGDTQ